MPSGEEPRIAVRRAASCSTVSCEARSAASRSSRRSAMSLNAPCSRPISSRPPVSARAREVAGAEPHGGVGEAVERLGDPAAQREDAPQDQRRPSRACR